jgi:phosphatidylglycerol:prolipoprotein diacylglycerol transferase
MYVAGFLCGWAGFRAQCKKPNAILTPAQVDDLVFYIMVGVIVGGRIGYMVLYDFGNLVGDPLSLFFIWEGGMSFHGGLLGVIAAFWVFARQADRTFLDVADGVAPWIAPGLGFGRIGNFINGELWGRQTNPDAPWAVIVDGVARHPSQLYEALLEGAVLFAVLWWYSRRPRARGAVSGLFLFLYAVFRFAVEFIRLPDDGIYFAFDWMTYGQLYCVPMFAFGAYLMLRAAGRGAARAA